MLQRVHVLPLFAKSLQRSRERRMVPPRRRQMHPGELQIHAVFEREASVHRHLWLYREDESCSRPASTGAKTHPRPTKACTEDQGTRTLLGLKNSLAETPSEAYFKVVKLTKNRQASMQNLLRQTFL